MAVDPPGHVEEKVHLPLALKNLSDRLTRWIRSMSLPAERGRRDTWVAANDMVALFSAVCQTQELS